VNPPDEQVAERLETLIKPATLAMVAHFHQQGLRERTLTLPIMMALLLTMVWRQISGVSELARLVQREALLWARPQRVSQQALSQRLSTMPSDLFAEVLARVLPVCHDRWGHRQRPLLPELAWAQSNYTQVVSVDGSTLDALIRKTGLLRDQETNPLAGKMTALLDVCSRLPLHIWYDDKPTAHDQTFWPQIQSHLKAGMLLIFDLGYTNFTVFKQLTNQHVTWITRAKTNLSFQVDQVIHQTAAVHDRVVWIGQDDARQRVRLVEVLYKGKWYRYLTNECDAQVLPTAYVVSLYWQRWRIEDAYNTIKRLLGLAYFWSGSQNAVELQLWTTWLLYAALVDLTDAVAEAIGCTFGTVSMEMVYRSLYHFARDHERGEADDIVAYLVENAKLLGIIKRKPPSGKLTALLTLTTASDP
jgi:hypothetical protein